MNFGISFGEMSSFHEFERVRIDFPDRAKVGGDRIYYIYIHTHIYIYTPIYIYIMEGLIVTYIGHTIIMHAQLDLVFRFLFLFLLHAWINIFCMMNPQKQKNIIHKQMDCKINIITCT